MWTAGSAASIFSGRGRRRARPERPSRVVDRPGAELLGLFLLGPLCRYLVRRGLIGRLQRDQARGKRTPAMLVEINHRVMLVDFDQRTRTIGGLLHAVALSPCLHRMLPAWLAASAATTTTTTIAAESAATTAESTLRL